MPINFEISSVEDWNNDPRRCGCCSEPECFYATIESQNRVTYVCRGGFFPWAKDDEDRPDGFDYEQEPSVRIPVYSTRTESLRTEYSGPAHNRAELYGSGDVLTDSVTRTQTYSFAQTTSTETKFGIALEDIPASNIPLGYCPTESSILPAAPPTDIAAIAGTPVSGIITVTVTWTDGRPDDTSDPPEPAGYYEIMVDGVEIPTTGDAEAEFDLLETDETCHEIRVRHVLNFPGAWSEPTIFSLTDDPCCVAEEPACNVSREGNPQESDPTAFGTGWTWEEEITGTSPSSDSGTILCDGMPDDTYPAGGAASWPFGYDRPIGGPSWVADIVGSSETKTGSVTASTTFYAYTYSSGDTDPTLRTWQTTESEADIEGEREDRVEYTDDRNISGVETTLWDEAVAIIAALDPLFNWTTGPSVAKWEHDYPKTPQTIDSYNSYPFGRMTELRYRWEVPADHKEAGGTTYTVAWDIAFFPTAWLEWRQAYWEWAVAKWAWAEWPDLDEEDRPEERPPDPGTAPVEPDDGPEIIDSLTWTWSFEQGEREDEEVPACDPSADSRPPFDPPEEPEEGASPEEIEEYEEALEAYEAAEAARAEASTRQSEWYYFTPEDMPEAAGVFSPANVRYTCGASPYGTIQNYDIAFPTTELPPLDPTETNPARWDRWWNWE